MSAMTYAKDAVPPFYHGTRADLQAGDLLTPGNVSNYADRRYSWIYFSASLDAAIWGAEWKPHPPERLREMKETLARMDAEGGAGIID